MQYTDAQFVDAVQQTSPERGQLARIATRVGCSKATASRRLKRIAAMPDAPIAVETKQTFDKQEGYAGSAALFGGAGVCIRRYLTARMKPRTLAEAFKSDREKKLERELESASDAQTRLIIRRSEEHTS